MANILPKGTGEGTSADIVAVEATPVTLSYIGPAGGSLIVERKASDGEYYPVGGPTLSARNSPLNLRINSTVRVRRLAGSVSCGCDRD